MKKIVSLFGGFTPFFVSFVLAVSIGWIGLVCCKISSADHNRILTTTVHEFAVRVDTNSVVDLANRFEPYESNSRGWRGVGDSLIRYDFDHGRVIGDGSNSTSTVLVSLHREIERLDSSYRPATLRELLCFAVQHKDRLVGSEVVGLGTKKVLQDPLKEEDPYPTYPEIIEGKSFAFIFHREWPTNILFAMVRQP